MWGEINSFPTGNSTVLVMDNNYYCFFFLSTGEIISPVLICCEYTTIHVVNIPSRIRYLGYILDAAISQGALL